MTKPTSYDSSFASESASANRDTDGRRTVERDDNGLIATKAPRERAILVGVELGSEPQLLSLEDSLAELHLLAHTAGVEIVGTVTQRLATPNPATLIGTGKLDELNDTVITEAASVVIYDDELSPRQQRETERVLGQEVKVLDRTALILDIFAHHAHTREGAVQVELAQY